MKRATFRMCNIPCKSVKVDGEKNLLVDIDGIPLSSLDDILEDLECREIADWLLNMDASDYITIMDIIKQKAEKE